MPSQTIHDSVFHSRAVCTPGTSIDDDPEPMVQQQFARLQFFETLLGVEGCRTLDWGCGSGFNCQWLTQSTQARSVLGFDVSADTVRLARQTYPGLEFQVADACSPTLDLQPGTWDRILSCEVLEHVPDMPTFLKNIRRHLAPDGCAFVTTPNRLVFSLDHEPSPVNREHVKELVQGEFLDLLRPHFSRVELFGQRFRDDRLLEAWEADVRRKIQACRNGTRWAKKEPMRAALRQWRLVNWAYDVPALRSLWRTIRWDVPGRFKKALLKPTPPYHWSDFEFVSADAPGVLWFCAVLRP